MRTNLSAPTLPSAIRSLRAAPLALALGVASLGASGCHKSAPDAAPAGTHAVTVDDKGFTPSAITLTKGGNGDIVFTRTSDETCATEVVFPEINVKKELPLGKPVTVSVPTDTPRTLTFQCGMAMFKSSVVIQ